MINDIVKKILLFLAMIVIALLITVFFLFPDKDVEYIIKDQIKKSNLSCTEISIKGAISKGILCKPNVEKAIPAIIAVSGWGSNYKSTQKVCEYFANRNWACLTLDSANSKGRTEEMTISDIDAAVETLKNYSFVDKRKISFWGGSNGARTTLIAASKRNDIYAVAAFSPPLIYDYDGGAFKSLINLNAHVIYVYGENDITDDKTAQELQTIVTRHGKTFKLVKIPGVGHEICCYNPEIFQQQYNFINELPNR